MRLRLLSRLASMLPFAIGLLAVAGIVHIASILLYPGRATADAFARIAATAQAGVKTDLVAGKSGIPDQDAAMAVSVCRYDLARGPFRITVLPFDDGFLSFGMHSRSGVAFYGLNLHASEGEGLAMVLTTGEKKTAADLLPEGEADAPPLSITAPEQQGFVMIEAPLGTAGGAQALLDHVSCGPADTQAIPRKAE